MTLKNKEKETMAEENFPEEMVEEILSRVPVKSLMRFKCLSKSHCALIRNHGFITKHFQFSTESAKIHHPILISHYPNDDSLWPRMTFLSDENVKNPVDLELPFSVQDQAFKIEVYGPCNGILCVYQSHSDKPQQLILWNPATREVNSLPLPHHYSSFCEGEYFTHGFGVDPKTDEYKVVSISMVRKSEMDREREQRPPSVELYNLSSNSWKKIDFTVSVFNLVSPKFESYLNGVYHWVSRDFENNQSIVCFDISKEVFWSMKIPDIPELYFSCENVAVIDGRLACINRYLLYGGHRCESFWRVFIWVMTEYGVEDSWTLRYVLPMPFGIFMGFWKYNLIFTRNYLCHCRSLFLYNVDTKEKVEQVPVCVESTFRYAESLFLLS